MINKSIAVIGGGIAGLTAALRLAQKGFKIKLFEALDRLGGLARTINIKGSPVEVFYHHFFPGDTEFFKISRELEIDDKIRWLKGKMGYFRAGNAYDFGTPASLLRFRPLSLFEKIRFGRSILLIKSEKSIEKMDRYTAQDWLVENVGRKVFDIVWKPLLIQKFGDAYGKISMAWLWKKIQTRSMAKKGWLGEEKLAYLDGSLEILINKLRERIIGLGGKIALSEKVKKVETNPVRNGVSNGTSNQNQHTVITDNSAEDFDAVVSTVAPEILRNLLRFPGEFNETLKGFKQLGVICVLLVLKRQLTKYYWLNIGDNSFPFGLAVEHTNFCSPQDFAGRHLLYLSKYLEVTEKLYSSFTDSEIADYFLQHLNRINSDFNREWVEEIYVFRSPFAQPIIGPNYLRIKPGYSTTLPGFYWISTHHIYPNDRGINASIKIAEEAVDLISGDSNN